MIEKLEIDNKELLLDLLNKLKDNNKKNIILIVKENLFVKIKKFPLFLLKNVI